MYKLVSVGADPETFVSKNGKIVPVNDAIPGTKWNPMRIPDTPFLIQRDCVAAEFNIPPAATLSQFTETIETGLAKLAQFLEQQNLEIVPFVAAHRFSMEELMEHPDSMYFGCDPDFNAWNLGRRNPPPKINEHPTLRSVGGHVHVGITKDGKPLKAWEKCYIVKLLDLTLGIPSVIYDRDTERSLLYGKAGTFRYKPYGIEYRTLSNFWIFEKVFVEMVYNGVQKAIYLANKQITPKKEWQQIINERNVELAKKWIDYHERL